ncbi:DUF2982 domain-containing protein [Catenovulum sp. 2E275]|uniref:DUF2982 domain-containing protein n=1 Tax=Catenovulum sp. 2E275 TaxID=2980497 RepID=UPI0021CE8842|nr:DUF2982 domain-containing protein [Catenovulum sp. 2E275]MCU4676894.1 DUF2982 domain-containing protein [Catenovulum sp. 2E275]
MSNQVKTQYISSVVKHNGRSLALVSLFSLFILIILFSELAHIAELKLPLIFLISASIVGVVIAVFKILEPDYSFMLSQEGLVYHHKKGFLLIEWENIQRYGIPTLHQGMQTHELAFIGIKLKDPEKILPSISLRLISHLLIEQRATFHQYLRNQAKDLNQSASELSLNTDPYKDKSGYVYKGLRGMFAHRMNYLRQFSGFDILIPSTALDRDAADFLVLLKQFQNEVVNNV